MKKLFILALALMCLAASLVALSSCGNGGGETQTRCKHEFKAPVVLKEPSCAEDGYEFTECRLCEFGTIKILYPINGGHKIEKIPAVEADCYKEGLTEGEKCSLCGEITLGQSSTGKVKHAYSNGICMVCGANANSEGLEFLLTANGEYCLKSIGTCDSENIIIPSEIDGKPVVAILDGAFKGCKDVKSIEVPDSVTRIGEAAFEGCAKLEKLVLPFVGGSLNKSGVASKSTLFGYIFGEEKVDGCYGVKQMITKSEGYTVYIPNSLKIVRISNAYSLPYGTFYGLKSLTSIEIVDGDIDEIGGRAFYGCSALAELYLPETYSVIGEYAFNSCSKLKSVEIPSKVTEIGEYAFGSCASLEGVVIPNGIEVISVAAFYKCAGIKEVTIPSSVTEICDYAFRECTSLEKVVLNDGIVTIGAGAFTKCGALSEIVLPSTVESLGDNAFSYCTALEELALNEGLTDIGDSLFYGCSALKVIEIPASVVTFGKDMFVGCTALNELVIDENNTEYASIDGVLYSKDLKTIILYMPGREGESFEIPASVEKIEVYAFYQNETLKTIVIPATVREIGEYAFSGMTALKSATINASINELTKNSFKGCANLDTIVLGESITSIGESAFYGSGLTEYVIPSHVMTIGKYAFAKSLKLTKIEIPSSLKVITESSLRECSSLETVVISDGVQEIGKGAFSKCSGLKNIVLPTSITKIGELAFNECTALTEIYIPITVGSMGGGVFQNCLKTCLIRCEAAEKPADWNKNWNNSDIPVIWNATND